MRFGLPVSVGVHLKWTAAATSDDRDWCFAMNQEISQRFKSLIQGPRIYRFIFSPPNSDSLDFGGKLQIYVGESEHFERRCADYKKALTKIHKSTRAFTGWPDPRLIHDWKEIQRNPCVRIAAALQNAERDKSEVELQLLEFTEFWINRIHVTPARMSDQFTRRLVENLAILSSDGPNIILLNRGRDPEIRPLSQALEELNAGTGGHTHSTKAKDSPTWAKAHSEVSWSF